MVWGGGWVGRWVGGGEAAGRAAGLVCCSCAHGMEPARHLGQQGTAWVLGAGGGPAEDGGAAVAGGLCTCVVRRMRVYVEGSLTAWLLQG